MPDKVYERAVLEMVYDPADFDLISEAEAPDFVLSRRRQAAYSFGVEVTDAYHSESSARLKNVPGYALHLLGGGQHKHRDDKRLLPVDEIMIMGPDGNVKHKALAIIQDLPPASQLVATLIERIHTKACRHSAYDAQLGHVNLIVNDRERRFMLAEPEGVHRDFFTEELRVNVLQCPFREVFLISEVKEKRTVFFRLKAIAVLAYAFFFVETLKRSATKPEVATSGQLWLSFARFMHARSLPVTLLGSADQPTEVLFGNTGLTLGSEKGLVMHDYRDHPVPRGWRLESTGGLEASDDFQRCFDQAVTQGRFVTDIAADVRSRGSSGPTEEQYGGAP